MRSVTVLLDCPPDAGLDDDSAFDASSRRQKRAHGAEPHAAVIRAAIPWPRRHDPLPLVRHGLMEQVHVDEVQPELAQACLERAERIVIPALTARVDGSRGPARLPETS
jgi:hypothetical protein